MPRVGQLLSALLIALIGVLGVQMFLFAALQQERARDQTLPSVVNDSTAAPASRLDTLLAADPIAQALSDQRAVVIIITTEFSPNSAVVVTSPAQSDGGKALIERFIALSGTSFPASQSGKES